jgi:hypothetical protein
LAGLAAALASASNGKAAAASPFTLSSSMLLPSTSCDKLSKKKASVSSRESKSGKLFFLTGQRSAHAQDTVLTSNHNKQIHAAMWSTY